MAFNSLNTIDKDCVTVAHGSGKALLHIPTGSQGRELGAGGSAFPGPSCYSQYLYNLVSSFPSSHFGYECWGTTYI